MNTVSELDWLKSSYSGSEGDDCVEVAFALGMVHVRDSKGNGRAAVRGVLVRVA